MNFLLVAMLAGLWIWLLSPGVLRDRRPRSPLASVDSFERYMDTLAPLSDPSAPGPVHGPARRPPRPMSPQRRRQLVLSRLLAALAATLPIALLFGGWTWALPAVAATLVAAYVVALAIFARRASLHARVRRLPAPERPAAERPASTTAEADRRAREA